MEQPPELGTIDRPLTPRLSEVYPAPVSGYEELRARHVALADRLVDEHVARISWSPAEVSAEQRRALRALLGVASARSVWHRERLAGIDLDSVTVADIETLPVMTKSHLMDNFDDIVTDRRLGRDVCANHLDHLVKDAYLFDEFHVVASGGSSGQPAMFVYGWEAWAICYASIVRFQVRDWSTDPELADVPRVTAVVAAAQATHLSAALGRTFSGTEATRHFLPVTLPLVDIVAGLNEIQPTILQGYSSVLHRLAVEARRGRLRIRPRRINPISEPLIPETRSLLGEVWGVPVTNGYGMSEGLFANGCTHGLHVPDDLCLVENVARDGQAVPPGQPGERILVTNLYNPALPLIRYEVTDEVRVIPGPCPCGSALRRIADPQGRLDDTFAYPDGITVHPHVFRDVLGQHRTLVEYQVRQTPRGATIAIVTAGPTDEAALAESIAAALRRVGLARAVVTTEVVTAIDRQRSGKLKRFVAL
jgi:phenylacetate-coenzyme A ligase PaaK-like adenylate-forming protein